MPLKEYSKLSASGNIGAIELIAEDLRQTAKFSFSEKRLVLRAPSIHGEDFVICSCRAPLGFKERSILLRLEQWRQKYARLLIYWWMGSSQVAC